MSQFQIAVIGVGALGRHHARILSQMEGVQLTAVADPGATGRTIAETCGTKWVADYRELLTEDALNSVAGRLDAVSIAVPTVLHREVATACLSAGLPVLVEKPLAANVTDARAIVQLAEQQKKPLQVGHIERFNPATHLAWSKVGEVKYVSAERLSPYSYRSTDIGVVYDLMIHDLDLILDLVRAPVESIEAFGLCVMGGHEDMVKARLRFTNGCLADLTASRLHPEARRQMNLFSTKGSTSVDFTTREVKHFGPSETLLFGQPPVDRARQPQADIEQLKRDVFEKFVTVETLQAEDADALTAELSSFVFCVRTGARAICTGEDALRSIEVAERILQSVAEHRWDGRADGAFGPHARFTVPQKMAG